jgi:hypothetical protein
MVTAECGPRAALTPFAGCLQALAFNSPDRATPATKQSPSGRVHDLVLRRRWRPNLSAGSAANGQLPTRVNLACPVRTSRTRIEPR